MKSFRFPLLFLGAVALLAGAIAALAINLASVATIGASGNRAAEGLLRIETLLSTVKDAETGGRGYLLTADEAYLEPYHQALREFGNDLSAAEAAVATDADRRRRLDTIGSLARTRLEHLRRTIELHRTAGPEAALAAVGTGEGRAMMRSLRDEVSALQRIVEAERDEEQRRAWWQAAGSAGLAFGVGGLATLLLGLAVLALGRSLAGRERSIAALLKERAGFEFERVSAGVLLDALPVGVVLADAAGRVVQANPEARRLLGGMPVEQKANAAGGPGQGRWLKGGEPLAPEDWPLACALRSGESVAGRMIRLRCPDGGENVVLNAAAPVRDAAGRLLGAVAIMQDMTERQREQDRRQEVEAQNRAIIETAVDAIATIDEVGNIRSFNPAAERIFGYAAVDVVGRNIGLLMPERIARTHDGTLARYAATAQRQVRWIGREVTARRSDGTEFPIELSLAEWRTGSGERRFTGLMRDLTERRRAEEALRESDRRLRELQAEFLHVARMSEIGQMAVALAHELNQPLAAAANYINGSRRLLDAPDATAKLPAIREALAAGARQAIEAGQIVRRMRGFVARSETERREEDLGALAGEAAALVSSAARQRRVEIRLDLDPAAQPRVLADRTQIQQVLVNLMHNAVEAMEEGERRTLTVSVRRAEGAMVEVLVADTGPGLPAEVAADLFKPFVTTKRHGAGVGLAVCRTIVEAHGGRIGAEPNPGGGTVFRFTLPAAAPAAMAADLPAPAGSPGGP